MDFAGRDFPEAGIHDETGGFAVLVKPPRMHCAPLGRDGEDTLLHRYAEVFPQAVLLPGRKPGEGGLVHRLDFETGGLVLVAKTRPAFDSFLEQQAAGRFVKEYSAVCLKSVGLPPGFPPPPAMPDSLAGAAVESRFRPFGPGRKQVRPVTSPSASGKLYRTEIVAASGGGRRCTAFTLRLASGFRHQIRCHLAWLGYPIANDPLYAPPSAPDIPMFLRACALAFDDPETGRRLEYRIAPLELPADLLYN